MYDLVVVGPLGWPFYAPNSAVAVLNGRIAALLSLERDCLPNARHVLRCDLLTAGFVDAHGHPALLGDQIATLDLTGVSTYQRACSLVQAAADEPGWLLGAGWDQNLWPDAPSQGWPLAEDLDQRIPNRPVCLWRVDRHAVWVNSAGLKHAGIGNSTEDPPGGRIIRDPAGAPLGVLVDRAAELIRPESPSMQQRQQRLRSALDRLASVGLTGVHDMGVDDLTFDAYRELDNSQDLPIRVWAYLLPDSSAGKALLKGTLWQGIRFRSVGIKVFADGALGSHGALLGLPYADDPTRKGLELLGRNALGELACRCLKAKVQLAVHCIGDSAVRNALDGFEHARKRWPNRNKVQFRLEHAQLVAPTDLRMMANLGVIASIQPTHATSDMLWAERMVGPERIRWAYAWRSLVEAGVPIALGSDFPIEDPAPARGVWAAVTRKNWAGFPRGGWYPEQSLALEEAILGFTRGAAVAVADGDKFGKIEVGAPADLTLWSVTGEQEAPRLAPIATIVGGHVVWADRDQDRRRSPEPPLAGP